MPTDYLPLPLQVLTERFAMLPGVGMKSAQRFAYAIMDMEQSDVCSFAEAMLEAKKSIHECEICRNLTADTVCSICSNPKRNPAIICVVEGTKDIAAFERSHEFQGVYHVLHGLISPLDNVTPDQLRIKELLARIGKDDIEEIILATSPTVEGDATAMYLARLCKPLGVLVTRLAFGVPMGASIEYTDEVTLSRALFHRTEM